MAYVIHVTVKRAGNTILEESENETELSKACGLVAGWFKWWNEEGRDQPQHENWDTITHTIRRAY